MTQRSSGFTIIELMLAMTFISMMLIAIAMTVIQIGNMYSRGITMREVNQTGRTVVSDMQRTIGGGDTFQAPGDDFIDASWGGRLCTGQYSYIWNHAERMSEVGTVSQNTSDFNVYDANDGDASKMIRLVRVVDAGGAYCRNPGQPIAESQSTELIDGGDRPLAVYDVTVYPESANTVNPISGQRLYTISFTIGTDNVDSIDATPGSEACLPPSDVASDSWYCSVNRFTFTTRAGVR